MSTPLTYRPDLVWSYEIGAKNSLFDQHLQLDSGVFYIAWQDMQLPVPLTNCGLGFTVNAGTATSEGFDLGASTHTRQWHMTAIQPHNHPPVGRGSRK